VLILRQGRIQADDTPENLQLMMTEGGQVVAEIAAPESELRACWEQMAEVQHADLAPVDGQYVRCTLVGRTGVDLRPLVFAVVQQRGWALRELRRSRVSLEDIFVRMTTADAEEEGS
jgi:ABC-2 type transport system ATP-binding protein